MAFTLRRRATITRAMIVVVVLPLLLPLFLQHWNRDNVSGMLAEAFHPTHIAPSTALWGSSNQRMKRTTPTKLECICVDCKWVTSCKAYHFVESKHEQPHMSEEPTFLPQEGSPTINVNIRTEQRKPQAKAGVDKNVAGMWKDQIREDEANGEEGEPKRDARYYEETGTVEAVRTNTTTTIEYDVVKCADFVQDKGCWVRNMPEEIKRVNPDFVPS